LCGRDYILCKNWRRERGVQPIGGWRGGGRRHLRFGFESEKIGYRVAGREFEIGSVNDFSGERAAASDVNSLRAMMRLLASGAGGGSGARSAEVFGTRKFVTGVIDNFVRLKLRGSVGTKAVDLARKSERGED
jgi:hypothetical protein